MSYRKTNDDGDATLQISDRSDFKRASAGEDTSTGARVEIKICYCIRISQETRLKVGNK